MINFRFHLISLVAVFLALGVGVAAGASFVDRATVESLQGRLEDLDAAYRDRGAELDATEEQLAESDRATAALAGDQSYALDDLLRDQPVVLIVSDGVPAELLAALRTTLGASGVAEPTLLRILPAAEFDDAAVVERVAASLGVEASDGAALRRRVVSGLGAALGLLSGPDAPGVAAPAPSTRPAGVPADASSALEFVRVLDAEGVVAVESASGLTAAAFGGGTGARYLEVISASDLVPASTVMVPLATSIADAAPATLTVGDAAPARSEGAAATTSTSVAGDPPDPLAPLRSDPVADRLSVVDGLEESTGRIAAAYSIGAQRTAGSVGIFGPGPGSSGPFPTVPPG